MKFLRVIRFDDSDERVFEHAANVDEWAISGAFEFANHEADAVKGKLRQAFANGFLGVHSFGRSTFAYVADISTDDEADVLQNLATHFVESYGAPSIDEAKPVARDEIEFVRELCADKPINTVFTVRRTRDENGDIREEFREIAPPDKSPRHTRIWEVVENDV